MGKVHLGRFKYYWYDLHADRYNIRNRNFDGRSLILWVAFSCFLKTPICNISAMHAFGTIRRLIRKLLHYVCQRNSERKSHLSA